MSGLSGSQPYVSQPGYTTHAPPAAQPQRAAEPVKRAYKVVGPREVFGAHKGETVELALTEGEETALIEAGHLVRANTNRPVGRERKGN